jgi:hypothetical protein
LYAVSVKGAEKAENDKTRWISPREICNYAAAPIEAAMLKRIEEEYEQEVEVYKLKILTSEIYHNDLPKKVKDEPRIVQAELEAGMRRYHERGYDVTRDRFFVRQGTKCSSYKEEFSLVHEWITFENFHQYYDFLNGDIYESACYYQYVFSNEEIYHSCCADSVRNHRRRVCYMDISGRLSSAAASALYRVYGRC